MSFRGYHGLTVWNRAVDLVEMVYRLTDTLQSEAAPEILADMRRAALAVPSHLAAGYKTDDTHEYLRHIHAAQLTVTRLDSQMTILERLEWAQVEDINQLQSLLTHLDHLLGCLERYLSGHSNEFEPKPPAA